MESINIHKWLPKYKHFLQAIRNQYPSEPFTELMIRNLHIDSERITGDISETTIYNYLRFISKNYPQIFIINKTGYPILYRLNPEILIVDQ